MKLHRYLRSPLGIAALSALTACSGSGLTPISSASQNEIQRFDAANTAPVEVVIQWKSALPHAQSVRIDVSTNESPSTIALTQVVDKPLRKSVSDVKLNVPVGKDTFAFTVFDQRSAGGNQLGGTTVGKTIRSGASNTVGATFTGYAAGFTVTPSDPHRMSLVYGGLVGQVQAVYDIAGQAPLTFTVAVKDVDGNVILSPNAPRVKAISVAKSTFTVAPVRGRQNTFTIQAIGAMPPFGSPNLVLEARGADGTTYTASYQLAETSLLYASAGSGASAHIYAFDTLGHRYTLPGTFPGLTRPVGLAHDTAKARIYVADAGASKLFAYDENGNAIPGWAAPSVPGITGVALSTHTGNVYASTSAGTGAVDVFSASGSPVSLPNRFVGLHAPPVGIAYDPTDRVIAVVENGTPSYIDLYTDGGTPLPNVSIVLTDENGGAFTPVSVAAAYDGEGDFWISGEDDGSPSSGASAALPVVALYDYKESLGFLCCTFFQTGFWNGALINSQRQGITAPLSTVVDPENPGVMYVLEASGPMWGFDCSAGNCITDFPVAIEPGGPPGFENAPLAGYVGTIRARGVRNFTAAVFGEY
jgi:hypothetical protein